jgi:WD40 repeat protein
MRGHDREVMAVAFSPDGKRLVSGGSDGTLRRWDPATGLAVGEPIRGLAHSERDFAFTPNGKQLIAGDDDGNIGFLDVTTGKPDPSQFRFPGNGRYQVSTVAFSSNGQLLVAGSSDGTLALWHENSRGPVSVPPQGQLVTAHTGPVRDVAFSPDGSRFASAGDDGTVRLWDPEPDVNYGRVLKPEGGGSTAQDVAFTAQGTQIISLEGVGAKVRVWDVATGKSHELQSRT